MRTVWMILSVVILALASGCGGSRGPGGDSESRLETVRERGVVRIGVKEDSRPFGFRLGGDLIGFDVDIATAVAGRLGADEIEFVPVTSATRIPRLRSGDVDFVAASMTITRSRDEQVDFSIPYFQDGQALLVPVDSDIESYLDLSGRLVGAVEGSTSAENIAQVAPGATVLTFADFDKLRAALTAGNVDAVTSDAMILLGMVGDGTQFRIAGDRFSTEPYGIALPENDSDWRDAINEALQDLWESGEYQLIFETWFGPGTIYNGEVAFGMTPYPR